MNREQVSAAVAAHYSAKFGGKVWCSFDEDRRRYCIRGEGLPAAPDIRDRFPNGWSLLDYLTPTKARQIATGDSVPQPLDGLRRARLAAGYTQREAGALFGVTQSQFAKYEFGRLELRARDAVTLAEAFGVTVESFYQVTD